VRFADLKTDLLISIIEHISVLDMNGLEMWYLFIENVISEPIGRHMADHSGMLIKRLEEKE